MIYLSNEMGSIEAPTITFFDFEATTKEPLRAEILTGHFRTVCAKTRNLENSLTIKMRPNKYLEESFHIHGISEQEAKLFPEKRIGMRDMFRYLSDYKDSLFICHANYNIFGVRGYFDWQLLKAECMYMDILHHFSDLFKEITIFSTHTMARDRKIPSQNYKLGTLAANIGFEFKAHDAEQDVLATEAIFWDILDRKNLITIMEEQCENTEHR